LICTCNHIEIFIIKFKHSNKEASASGKKQTNIQDTEDKGNEEEKDEPQDLFDEEADEKSEWALNWYHQLIISKKRNT
jgi:hypothetical protein